MPRYSHDIPLRRCRIPGFSVALLLVAMFESPLPADPLEVCTTVPDLGSLCEEIGGDEVDVTSFTKGPQDPHFMEARPSFIKALSRADLFLQVGLDLEIGWAPRLLLGSRNPKVQRGASGFFDASTAGIQPLDRPAGVVDRTLGDVHALGNPHYLLDPINGLKVASAIRDRLLLLRPEKKAYFDARYDGFAKRLGASLLGKRLVEKYDPEKALRLYELGGLEAFLKEQGDQDLLGGWVARLAKFRGTAVVGDHNMWPYFAKRFGLEIVGYLEPKPGIAPTTRHLAALVGQMKALDVKGILAVVYFDSRHARFVAENTGAKVIELAHQCGSRPGTDDYLSMVEYNVAQLEAAFGEKR
jgi:ABC-type Zn uptake system ZnuABC Zn-binding protein ZnuA